MKISNYALMSRVLCILLIFFSGCDSDANKREISPLEQIIADLDETDRIQAAQKPTEKQVVKNRVTHRRMYPGDQAPPEGTAYACPLTPLPDILSGIPATDVQFIDAIYALILKAIYEKLLLIKALESSQQQTVLAKYLANSTDLQSEIAMIQAPNVNMKAFKESMLRVLSLQRTFFKKLIAQDSTEPVSEKMKRIPERKEISATLKAAWKLTRKTYPNISSAVRDSLFNHLCALDIA